MKRLCVVDDDDGIRESMRFLFEETDFHVEEAANGTDALAILHSEAAPRVLLLDRMMPRCDGACVLTALAARPDLRARTAVVFVTARGDPPDEVLADLLRNYATAVVRKPFDLDLLVSTVERAWQLIASSGAEETAPGETAHG